MQSLIEKIPLEQQSQSLRFLEEMAMRRAEEWWWYLAVFQAESQVNPKAQNSWGACGIFQCMPETAKELGLKSSTELLKKSFLEQCQYFEKYLNLPRIQSFGTLKSYFDVYAAVLYPPMINQSDRYVFAQRTQGHYKPNEGLDLDKNGETTRAEIKQWFRRLQPNDVKILIDQADKKPNLFDSLKNTGVVLVERATANIGTSIIGLEAGVDMLAKSIDFSAKTIIDPMGFIRAMGIIMAGLFAKDDWLKLKK